jgi:hypothetical protein
MRRPTGGEDARKTMKNLKHKTLGLLIAAAIGLGAMPAAAVAQDSFSSGPTSDQYDPSTTTFENRTDSGGGFNDSVGGLPFTGFDVVAMLAVALAVTGLGLALQRAVSREPRDLR